MISALIISFYDHDYINECINSLAFVDEIIIIGKIDSEVLSKIKHKNPIKFIDSEYHDFDFLLKKATSKINHNWIIKLEVNHSISKQLAEEINEIVVNTESTENYKVKTRFKFMGSFLKFSGYQTSYCSFLFHKNSIGKNSVKKLKYPIDELYLDFDRYNKRLTKNAKQKAQLLSINKIHPNFFHFIWNPLWKLKTTFIFKLGFLDGKKGFVFAYLKGFKEFKTYLFLWLMHRNID